MQKIKVKLSAGLPKRTRLRDLENGTFFYFSCQISEPRVKGGRVGSNGFAVTSGYFTLHSALWVRAGEQELDRYVTTIEGYVVLGGGEEA